MQEIKESDILKDELLTLIRSLKGKLQLDRELHHPLSWIAATMDKSTESNVYAQVCMEHESDLKGSQKMIESDSMRETALEEILRDMEKCHRCSLGKMRKNLVFGEGNPHAKLVFVGEAPGAEEDLQGRPFVGRAGQLLTKIVDAMGLKREDVYICNILKCRPPGNRNPLPEEIESCEPYLIRQLGAIQPSVICALGTFAAQTLLKKKGIPITVLRGQFHDYHGIQLMPTYHPAYLLRNPGAKKQVWEDVQQIMKVLAGGQ
jgi:uracil-DNA glycosylase